MTSPITNGEGAALQEVLDNNRRWAANMVAADPEFFNRLATQQAPDYLWIGCADSRVPANEILGLPPGAVFVQRNVGNLATHKDMNCMSCLEYAVNALKVKHIIICGHYNCGAVNASLNMPARTPTLPLVNHWISELRDMRNMHADSLKPLDGQARFDKMCELNVKRQVFNVCTSPVVQAAWGNGQELAVHGLIYGVHDGVLQELTKPITCQDDMESFEVNSEDEMSKSAARMFRDHLFFEEANGKK